MWLLPPANLYSFVIGVGQLQVFSTNNNSWNAYILQGLKIFDLFRKNKEKNCNLIEYYTSLQMHHIVTLELLYNEHFEI